MHRSLIVVDENDVVQHMLNYEDMIITDNFSINKPRVLALTTLQQMTAPMKSISTIIVSLVAEGAPLLVEEYYQYMHLAPTVKVRAENITLNFTLSVVLEFLQLMVS